MTNIGSLLRGTNAELSRTVRGRAVDAAVACAHTGAMRLRLGIALWLASWLPIPLLLGVTGDMRYVIWGIQVVVGIVGLAIAGTQFAATIKSVGWRATPAAAWKAFVHGTDAPTSAEA